MNIKSLDHRVTVSGQLSHKDIATLKAQGVAHIICNRPDGEALGQPTFASIAAAAQAQGISTTFMPITHVTLADAKMFQQVLTTTTKPVHAYCRSGTRCTNLWALAAVQSGEDPQRVIKQAAQVGYDVSASLTTIT